MLSTNPNPISWRRSVRVAGWLGLAALLISGPVALRAANITNVMAVNVTPSGFTILCRAGDAAPSLAVYADPEGVTNLAGQVGIEPYPLHTGNPGLLTGYERRQNWKQIREKTRGLGLAQFRVTGCAPGSTYYYRLTALSGGAVPETYPASLPLPEVTTPKGNSFLTNAQQVLIEVPGVDTEGRIVTLAHPQAARALSAVVGDGANTNQAWFNLGDLFDLAGAGNFTPLGLQEFTLTLLGGPNQDDLTQTLALNISPDFQVGSAASGSFGIEYFAVYLGSIIMRVGETSSVPVTINCNARVTEISADLHIPTDRLADFTFTDLPGTVQTATLTPQSPTNALLLIRAAAGQAIQGQMLLANLRFRAVSNQSSAFVPLKWLSLNVTKSGNELMEDVFAQDGQITIIGREPLLGYNSDPDTRGFFTLYGNPWSSYAIEYTTRLGLPWATYLRCPLTNFTFTFKGLDAAAAPIAFYRAVELPGDPPILEARRTGDQTRSLLVFGKPGSQYTVQYATNLSGVVTWRPMLSYTLTNSFRHLNGLVQPGPIIFLRLQRE